MPKSLEIFMTKTVTGTVTQKSAYDRDLARKRLRNTALVDRMIAVITKSFLFCN